MSEIIFYQNAEIRKDKIPFVCACVCTCLTLKLGVIALCLWAVARTISKPECYMGAFYVPAFNKTLNTTSNSTIVFMVEFDNVDGDHGIRYDNVNLTFAIFLDQNTTSPIGNSTIEGFYHKFNKNTEKWGSVETHAAVLNRTPVVDRKTYFRVDFRTSMRYKFWSWYVKRRSLWGGANIPVDDSGQKVGHKGIRLGDSLPVIGFSSPRLAGCHSTLIVPQWWEILRGASVFCSRCLATVKDSIAVTYLNVVAIHCYNFRILLLSNFRRGLTPRCPSQKFAIGYASAMTPVPSATMVSCFCLFIVFLPFFLRWL